MSGVCIKDKRKTRILRYAYSQIFLKKLKSKNLTA
jgi:hypothetical protein